MLGTELCDVLAENHDVVGLDITEPHAPCPTCSEQSRGVPHAFYKASITDFAQVREAFDKEEPELVIHAAAWTDVDGCEKEPVRAYDVNVSGTRNVADAAEMTGASVIFISTDFVFDGEKSEPYAESDTCGPISVYGKTKWEAENILRQHLSRCVIVRTSWLYGKHGKNFVDSIVAKGKAERRLRVVNDQIGSPTYAKDLARALKELVRSVNDLGQEIFHVSNSGYCSWYEFALRILLEAKGMEEVSVEPVTTGELARPAPRPGFSALGNKKFKEATNHKMRPWQEALCEYVRERGF